MKILARIVLLAAVAVVVSISYRFIRSSWIEFRRAERLFAKGDCASASVIYRKLAAVRFSGHNEVISRLCECHLKNGEQAAAREMLADINPDDRNIQWIWMRLGGAFAQAGLFSDASEIYARSLKANPENCQVRYYRARVLVALGEFAEAEMEFRSLLGSCVCLVGKSGAPLGRSKCAEGEMPECEIRLELARVHVYRGEFLQARSEYMKALAQRPEWAEVRWELARVTFWSGDPAEALRIIEGAPQDNISDEDAVLKADLQMIARDYAGTEATLKALLGRSPDNDVARMKLAEILSWGRKLKEAAAHYEILIEKRPEDSQVRRKYAELLFWMGRNREAAKQLRISLRAAKNG